jgi:hypothetical protein
MRRIGLASVRALVVTIALTTLASRIGAQTSPIRTLGTFPWDLGPGDVLLQWVAADRVLVQLRVLTESNTTAGRRQSRRVPTEAMEAWVLLQDGKTLEQTPKDLPRGAQPPAVGNAGSRLSFVTFGFKSSPKPAIVAVVVKVEDHLYVYSVPKL